MKKYKDKLKVNWIDEGLDGDNNGYIYGIYYYDMKICEENPDTDVIDVEWFNNESTRDKTYIGECNVHEKNGRYSCDNCGYEYSAMMGDDEIPMIHSECSAD